MLKPNPWHSDFSKLKSFKMILKILFICPTIYKQMYRPGATIRPTRRSPRAQGKGGRRNDQKRGAKLIKVVVTKDKNGDNFSLEKYSV